MPGYREAVAKMLESDARQQAEQTARDQLAGYIAGLFTADQVSMPSHCQTDYQSEVTLHLGSHGGRVKFHGDGSEVEFERFRVPAGVALRMLETVALLT